MIQFEVWGDMACFSRPEMKVERVSYDVITPSAARGLLESIYFHPGLRYTIDRIYVCSPIRFTNIRRNEVKSKITAGELNRAYNGSKEPIYIDVSSDIQQRATTALSRVHYVIEAHFDMTDKAAASDNPGKFQDILKRRLRKGQCYSQPYFGCREFPANFRLWEGKTIPAIPDTRDLGYMLYDMDYRDPENITPMFFRAQMVNGVIDLTNCGVVR